MVDPSDEHEGQRDHAPVDGRGGQPTPGLEVTQLKFVLGRHVWRIRHLLDSATARCSDHPVLRRPGFVHERRLPHVLEPGCYHRSEHHELELGRVFRPRWLCVATDDELAREGDFVTRELLGVPLLIRRTASGLVALRNVCAHRYCLISNAPSGRMRQLRCPYHGWRYGDAGELVHIPDAESFAQHADQRPLVGSVTLERFQVATRGPLVFVCLDREPPTLEETLGRATLAMIDRVFGTEPSTPRYQPVLARELDHPCNWKIPIENVLETYHVAEVHRNWLSEHPRLVRVFSRDEEHVEHELGEGFSEYRDRMGADLAPYRALVRLLARDEPCAYRHHHRFPGLILAETPLFAFLQVVSPSGPKTSRSMVRLWLRRGGRATEPLRAVTAALATRFVTMVLREDAALYPSIQRGLESTERRGVLGVREERVWAFQRWLAAAVKDP
jgi:phenylpropionate dioxygenase-like ring-hydroxylating dioxygenase large terminal subunit